MHPIIVPVSKPEAVGTVKFVFTTLKTVFYQKPAMSITLYTSCLLQKTFKLAQKWIGLETSDHSCSQILHICN